MVYLLTEASAHAQMHVAHICCCAWYYHTPFCCPKQDIPPQQRPGCSPSLCCCAIVSRPVTWSCFHVLADANTGLAVLCVASPSTWAACRLRVLMPAWVLRTCVCSAKLCGVLWFCTFLIHQAPSLQVGYCNVACLPGKRPIFGEYQSWGSTSH